MHFLQRATVLVFVIIRMTSANEFLVGDMPDPLAGIQSTEVALVAESWILPVSLSDRRYETKSVLYQPFGEPWIDDEPESDHNSVQPLEALVTGVEVQHKNTGFLDLNSYWDTRESVTTTVNAGANLKHGFQYFQLLNLDSPFGSGSYDWTTFYTELNLRRPVSKRIDQLQHLDWAIQYADGNAVRGVLRAGVRYRFHDAPGPLGEFFRNVLKLKYNITFFVTESDGSGWQMEHTYRRTFFNDRVYAAAFVDHHINDNSSNSDWVTEHQVGVRLFDQWHAVGEYRYKSFAASEFKSGLGIGLEYVVQFK